MRFQQNRDASCHQVFFFVQGKAPKEIHTILTEILACFLPGRAKDQEGNKLGSTLGMRAISTKSRCEQSSSFFFFLQGKALKEIHAILTETLACFLPGRAKDISTPL